MTIQINQKELQIVFEVDIEDLSKLFSQLILSALKTTSGDGSNYQCGSSAPDEDEQVWQQRMLEQHLENWRKIHEMLAIYPEGEKPLSLLNQLEAEEKAINLYQKIESNVFKR